MYGVHLETSSEYLVLNELLAVRIRKDSLLSAVSSALIDWRIPKKNLLTNISENDFNFLQQKIYSDYKLLRVPEGDLQSAIQTFFKNII